MSSFFGNNTDIFGRLDWLTKRIKNLFGRVAALEQGGGGGAVTSIIAGTNVTISPTNGLGDVTINSAGAPALTIFSWDFSTDGDTLTIDGSYDIYVLKSTNVLQNNISLTTTNWDSNKIVKILVTTTSLPVYVSNFGGLAVPNTTDIRSAGLFEAMWDFDSNTFYANYF